MGMQYSCNNEMTLPFRGRLLHFRRHRKGSLKHLVNIFPETHGWKGVKYLQMLLPDIFWIADMK